MNETKEFINNATKRVMFTLNGKHEKILETEEYRRTQIVNLVLICEIVGMLIFGLLNIMIYEFYLLGGLQLVFSFFCGVVFWSFQNYRTYKLASWFSVSIFGILLIVFVIYIHAKFNSMMLFSLFPLIAFYVLGLRQGLVVYLSFCAIMFCIIIYGTIYWDDLKGTETLSNLIGTAILAGLFIYIYEYTKEEAFKHIIETSRTDGLTKTWNRKMFDELLQQKIDDSIRYNRPLSLIMADIDHFKKVNDVYGHQVGDNILIEFSKLIAGNIRSVDSLSRWGGEEFMILAPNIASDNAEVLAKKLNEIIATYKFQDVERITSSFGVTQFKFDESSDQLLKRVDDALYQAKEKGRNTTVLL